MHNSKNMNYKIILIGISGSGKTTIGKLLFKYFKISFIEGDKFHSLSSKIKMQKGIPLNNNDRVLWHKRIQRKIKLSRNWVLSCSALGRWQRKILCKKNNNVYFIHCRCEKNIIKKRIGLRIGHFFSPNLLENQIRNFEEPINIPHIFTSNSKSSCLMKIFSTLKKNRKLILNNRSNLARL